MTSESMESCIKIGQWYTKKVDALPDEQVIYWRRLNYIYSESIYSSVGGAIYITSKRLLFLPNLAEFLVGFIVRRGRKPWWVPIHDIKGSHLQSLAPKHGPVLPVIALVIELRDVDRMDSTARFSTFSQEEIMNAIAVAQADRLDKDNSRSMPIKQIVPPNNIGPLPWINMLITVIGTAYFTYVGVDKRNIVAWILVAAGIILLVFMAYRGPLTRRLMANRYLRKKIS
ncbi:MAG: hypothetical protein M1399_00540 [Actinobacteria bacterium]|nr:hypothetical protein [Actinomycetota bacterium]MCL5447303.1 hypothetical protein [Actinomycetota bacterium]